MPKLRQWAGCWLNERWRVEMMLRTPFIARALGMEWLDVCNRSERLLPDAVSGGRMCSWEFSSDLTVQRVFPDVGPRLLRHVLRRWPIDLDFGPSRVVDRDPRVSILIPIGGRERLPQFELALAAARGQRDVEFEVIVVEQADTPLLADSVPSDVRHVYQERAAGARFNKSAAVNCAARAARGDVLVLLDADYLIPVDFAAECARVLCTADAARPARFIFHLDPHSTSRAREARSLPTDLAIERIVSNNPTPIAVRAATYWSVGGHDETYLGWGGEDTEFIDRLRTQTFSEGGWMPVVHAWHPAAQQKSDGTRNRLHHEDRMHLDARSRIERLLSEQPLTHERTEA
jgi:hypothetical protein